MRQSRFTKVSTRIRSGALRCSIVSRADPAVTSAVALINLDPAGLDLVCRGLSVANGAWLPSASVQPPSDSAAQHGLSLGASLRKHADKLEQNGGGRHASDPASVEGRRDLDEIGANEIETPKIADQTLGFKCR